MHVWTLFQGGWGALPLGNYSPTFLLLSTLKSHHLWNVLLPYSSLTFQGKGDFLREARPNPFITLQSSGLFLRRSPHTSQRPHVCLPARRPTARGQTRCPSVPRGAPPRDSALHAGARAPKCLRIGPNESSGPQYEDR